MRIETAIKIDKEILDLIKEKAKSKKQSLSFFIENILYQEIHKPNEETSKAIEDAHKDKNLTEIRDLDDYINHLLSENEI